MNVTDRKEFELIHNKIDDIKKDIDEMKHEASMGSWKDRRVTSISKRKPIQSMRDYETNKTEHPI